jgi:hypothetical protein
LKRSAKKSSEGFEPSTTTEKRRKSVIPMPQLMLKCKTCGEVFLGIYVPEGSNKEFKAAAATTDTLHICSRARK